MKYDTRIKDVVFPEFKTKSKKIKFKIEGKRKIINNERMYVFYILINKKNQYFKNLKSLRILASKKQRDFLTLIEGEKRTSKKTLYAALGKSFFISDEVECDKKTSDMISELTNDKDSTYSAVRKLRCWTKETAKFRRENVSSRAKAIPDDAVYECPSELPEGLLQYIKEEIIGKDRTLVYKKGNVRGICSCCGESVRASAPTRFTQSSVVNCPNCWTPVTCVLENSNLWRADYVDNVVVMQKGTNANVWFRQFHIIRDNNAKYENLESWVSECARYLITPGKVAMWRSYYKSSSWIGRCDEYKLQDWERSKKFYVYDGQYTFYDVGVRETVDGTCLQYADIPGYLLSYQKKDVIMYSAQFARYPVIEFLHKAGYRNIVSEKVRGGNYEYDKAIKWSGKKLKDCFSFPLEYLKAAPARRWTLKNVDLINNLWKSIKPCDVSDMLDSGLSKDCIKDVIKYTSIIKASKYLKKQNSDFSIYYDYLKECEELKLDLGREEILFPKNLLNAHAANTNSIEFKKDPEAFKRFDKVYKKLKKLSYENEIFVITPAPSAAALKLEGEALNHCVYRYAKDMSQERTAILFVRKKEEPEKPYYTLELKKGVIVQCRTKGNKSYTADAKVYDFCQEWLNKKILA